jgi:hypothetical protein
MHLEHLRLTMLELVTLCLPSGETSCENLNVAGVVEGLEGEGCSSSGEEAML